VPFRDDETLTHDDDVMAGVDSCLTACHLDACMKQESHGQAYKDCRLNCPDWNHCMASEKCTFISFVDIDCDGRDCIVDDLCGGNDCVAGNSIDIENLAGDNCDCVSKCHTDAGFSHSYINCDDPQMYTDCPDFLDGLKPPPNSTPKSEL
jgi:hypothetical protein